VVADDPQPSGATIMRHDTRGYGVQGAIVFDSVAALWRQSVDIFPREGVFQIDLAQVTRTDSAGLALLVEWLREASRRGARVELVNFPAQMLALAGAANLEHVLTGKKGPAQS
jgi:phospholipid transport system transporter-binding protein